jgi:mono/diheme cytochrome c family protein
MFINTFLLGFGLFLLGCFPSKNLARQSSILTENNYTLVSIINRDKIAEQNLQLRGKEIYADFCIQCHGANGKGDGIKIPPLAGSDWLIKKRKESIHAVKFGQSGEIFVNKIKFNNVMPVMGLSNQEVADVMNYIMNSWDNKQKKKVTEKEVEGVLY